MVMQTLQIGGGELAQTVWFSLKALGVKSSGIMSIFISHIGLVIQEEKLLDGLFEELYKLIVSKTDQQHVTSEFKENVKNIFIKAKHDIGQFITTNIPELISSGTMFSLSFNGSSLLVSTNQKRGD